MSAVDGILDDEWKKRDMDSFANGSPAPKADDPYTKLVKDLDDLHNTLLHGDSAPTAAQAQQPTGVYRDQDGGLTERPLGQAGFVANANGSLGFRTAPGATIAAADDPRNREANWQSFFGPTRDQQQWQQSNLDYRAQQKAGVYDGSGVFLNIAPIRPPNTTGAFNVDTGRPAVNTASYINGAMTSRFGETNGRINGTGLPTLGNDVSLEPPIKISNPLNTGVEWPDLPASPLLHPNRKRRNAPF